MRKYAIEASGTGWRKELSKRKVQWTERNLDKIHEEIEEFVYLKALNGTSLAHLARMFGVSTQEFERVYGDLYRYASGELQDIVKQDTLKYCLKSQQPVAKIWIGKSFGGLSEAGRTVDVEQDASSDAVLDEGGVLDNVVEADGTLVHLKAPAPLKSTRDHRSAVLHTLSCLDTEFTLELDEAYV